MVLRHEADFKTLSYTQKGMQTQFVVERPKGQAPLSVTLNLPGRHNVLNALLLLLLQQN